MTSTARRILRWRPRFSLRTLAVFLLLMTSGVGLWWHWEPWPKTSVINLENDGDIRELRFSSGARQLVITAHSRTLSQSGDRLHLFRITRTYDSEANERLSRTEEEVWIEHHYVEPESPLELCRAKDGKRTIEMRFEQVPPAPAHHFLVLVKNGQDARDLAILDEWHGYFSASDFHATFSPNGRAVAFSGPGNISVSIYRRRRPEWWWGVFWLWEFWLTAALATAFVWSLVADRRRLARANGAAA